MMKYTLLAAASLGCAVLTIGCQNSGHSTAEADYNERPAATAAPAAYSTTADAYTTPYTLKHGTSYMTTPTSTTAAGTLRAGDTVYLRTGTLDSQSNNGWVQAKTADGRMVYVHTDDLQMK